MVHQEQLSIRTSGHGDMHDLTSRVSAVIASSGIHTGTAHIFNVGSTAAIGAIEFEPGLQRDVPQLLDKLIPPSRSYGHEQAWHDGNGHSHLHGDAARAVADRTCCERKTGARNMAADFPS